MFHFTFKKSCPFLCCILLYKMGLGYTVWMSNTNNNYSNHKQWRTIDRKIKKMYRLSYIGQMFLDIQYLGIWIIHNHPFCWLNCIYQRIEIGSAKVNQTPIWLYENKTIITCSIWSTLPLSTPPVILNKFTIVLQTCKVWISYSAIPLFKNQSSSENNHELSGHRIFLVL